MASVRFEIGDLVELVNDSHRASNVHAGDRFTVIHNEIDTDSYFNKANETVEIQATHTWPSDFELVTPLDEQGSDVIEGGVTEVKPIKSDGGSSSYYDIPIPAEFIQVLVKRLEEGNPHVRTEELIRYVYDNDFDFGTLFKSSVRAHGCIKGGGKEGNDVAYDANKVIYYATKIKEIHSK